MSIFHEWLENVRASKLQLLPFDTRVEAIHYKIPLVDSTVVRAIESSKTGPWICGGACLRWYQGQQITDCGADIDVYVASQKQVEEVTQRLSSLKGFHVVTTTNNAITCRIRDGHEIIIQIITKLIISKPTTIKDVIDTFDMSVCKVGFDGSDFYVASDHFFDDARTKTIRMDAPYQKGALTRVLKYMSQGYKPVPGLFNDLLDCDSALESLADEYDA